MDSTTPSSSGMWPLSSDGDEGATVRPFNMYWLDSTLQETLLPGSPWEQIEDKVSRGLVRSIKRSAEFKEMEKKQMILQLLGATLVEKHFKDELYIPNILEPPRITLKKRQQLQRSMQKFLKEKLDDVAEFYEYLPSAQDAAAEEGQQGQDNQEDLRPEELRVMQEHTRAVFKTRLTRHMAVNGYTADKAISDNIPDHSRSSMNSWSDASNLLGLSLCAILQRDPNRLPTICKRLSGKQLPASLREFLWAEVLLRHSDTTLHVEKTTEKSLRKAFAKMVSKGKLELKISKATKCPISGLISKTVQEKYENTVCMQQNKTGSYTSHSSHALNVLFTYNRSYEPFLVHWLYPLQLAFQDIGGESEDHPYELAFYLNLLQSNTFPRWPEIYAIAEQVMARVQSADGDLYEHMQSCSTTNVKVDPKEFMVQLLADERKKAASLNQTTSQNTVGTAGQPDDPDTSKMLLANPVVFLRKWVGEGFVSVLDTQAVLYVWDQCFMSDWDRQVLEDVCLALVLLLRRDFMQATDYHQMRQINPHWITNSGLSKVSYPMWIYLEGNKAVFLHTPCKLYTADIQAAFRHLQAYGAPTDVPGLDRRHSNLPTDCPDPTPPTPVPEDLTLCDVGMRDIQLKLVISQPDVRKSEEEDSSQLGIIEQLVNFDVARLQVAISLWYKGTKLRDKACDSVGVAVKMPTLGKENPFDLGRFTKTYQVSFSCESLVFDGVIMNSTIAVELKEKENQPYAVISLTYGLPDSDDMLTLGWTTLPLYEYQPDTTTPTLDGTSHAPLIVKVGKGTAALFPGDVPEDFTATALNTEFKVDDYIQEGSAITMTLVDPSDPDIPREPTASPSSEDPLWVLHDSEMAETLPPFKPDQGFDLYVDQIRLLPDNATIVKVTGRIINPQTKNGNEFLTTPVLDSPARCPLFHYREITETAIETSLAVLRVYTVEKITNELVLVGVAFLPLYIGEDHQLNVGGFQLQLNQTPSKDASILVPGTTILIRILPRTKLFIQAPDYLSGYYKNNDQTRPNQSHSKVMEHYRCQENWSETVQDVIEQLQTGDEGATESHQSEDTSTDWLIDRLDVTKHLPEEMKTPANLNLTRCVNYDLDNGLHITVHSTPCIAGAGLYTQVVCQVLPGRAAASKANTPEGYGVVQRFHTIHHKYSCLQTAPQWKDPPKLIHPHYDPQSYLFLRLIGLTALYTPDPSGDGPGILKGKHGKKNVVLGPESYLGWTVLPIFDRGCVAQGTYILPVFQDDQELDFLNDISEAENLLTWLKNKVKKKVIMVDRQYATAIVSVFDGHFVKGETVPLPKKDVFLDVDEFEQFAAAAQHPQPSPKMCQLVLKGLPKEVQEKQMDSPLYKQEEKYFEELMLLVFDELLQLKILEFYQGISKHLSSTAGIHLKLSVLETVKAIEVAEYGQGV